MITNDLLARAINLDKELATHASVASSRRVRDAVGRKLEDLGKRLQRPTRVSTA